MGNSAKRDERKAARAEQCRIALEMRRTGATYDQIAIAMKVRDRAHVYRLVQDAIEAIPREAAKDVLALELQRLDRDEQRLEAAHKAIERWVKPKALDATDADDPKIKIRLRAMQTMIRLQDGARRIQERRAAYLGLDVPRLLKPELAADREWILNRFRTQAPDIYERACIILADDDGTAAARSDSGGAAPSIEVSGPDSDPSEPAAVEDPPED